MNPMRRSLISLTPTRKTFWRHASKRKLSNRIRLLQVAAGLFAVASLAQAKEAKVEVFVAPPGIEYTIETERLQPSLNSGWKPPADRPYRCDVPGPIENR